MFVRQKNTFFEQQNDSSGAVLHMFEWMFLFFLCLDDDDDDDGKWMGRSHVSRGALKYYSTLFHPLDPFRV